MIGPARQALACSRGFSPELLLLFTFLSMPQASLKAQQAFESDARVVYEDAGNRRINLGPGFSPVLTASGKVALIRGRRFDYGAPFDCSSTDSKNWIALYDPAVMREKTIFDRPLQYGGPGDLAFCIFEQMQLSHDASTLYLVSPVYATSGSLAIVDLPRGSVSFVPGVNSVYVIQTGPHRDELIYQRRLLRKSVEDGLENVVYPFVHARADGEQITEISDEVFTIGGNGDEAPLLKKYLRKIDGTITVNAHRFP